MGIGIVMTLVALSAKGNRSFESFQVILKTHMHWQELKILLTILVDFRGFDTMLEILVLSIAGLGVYALIKLRMAGEEENEGTK